MHHIDYTKVLTVILIVLTLVAMMSYANLSPGQILISDEQEVALGKYIAQQFESKAKILDNPTLTAYIDDVGQKLAEVCDRKDIKYHFKIVDEDIFNAFALPGGLVYIYRGLLQRIDNEAELSAVLGHEIAHIAARHCIMRVQAEYGYEMLKELLNGLIFQTRENENLQQVSDFAFAVTLQGFGRINEFIADSLGTRYAYRAKYNPKGMEIFLNKVQTSEVSKTSEVYVILLASHPPTDDRIKKMQMEIKMLYPHDALQLEFYEKRYKENISALFQKRIAILPFINRASEQLSPFVRGISEMLSSRLSEAKQLVIIESEQVERALKDIKPSLLEDQLDEMDVRITSVGKRLRADFLISGRLIEAGGHRIDVQIFETKSGEMVSECSADSAEGIDSINQLATALLNTLVKVGATQSKQIITPKKKIAVLYFKNLASREYDAFVGSMPTMLEASLKKSEGVNLIERAEIQKRLQGFELEPGGVLDQNRAVQLGTSLGADILLLGNFMMSDGICQLNAVLIDAKTGKILDKQGVESNEANLMMLPGKLGEKLITSSALAEDVRLERERTSDIISTGLLEVEFRLTRAPMTERAVHYHVCKLFVDGKFIKISSPVKKLDEWITLFSEPLQVGEHDIDILHGYVTQEGDWKDKFHKQPRKFHVTIASSETTHIKYEYKVDLFSDSYKYYIVQE
ncbi:hypothetical protein FJZ31_40870 [Candidatus Poribacteria bacterium]|nr:hypothetical protein [Candidatus Poribacteria bacterium]